MKESQEGKWSKSRDRGLTWSWTPSYCICRHTLTGDSPWSLVWSSCPFNVMSFQFHKYLVLFLIIVLFTLYSGFLECSLPKHLCGSFLLFSFFLAQINHQKSFPWAQFQKQIYPIPLTLSPLLVCLQTWILFDLLFIIFKPVLLITVRSLTEKCLFCPRLYLLPRENMTRSTLYVLFAQKNISSCSYLIVHFGFHFLV